MILKKEEKEKLVIDLAMAGKSTKKIAQIAHVSLKDIGTIIRKFNGEEPEYQNKSPSVTSKAFQMFKEGKNRVDVAIALNLEAYEVIDLFQDYLKVLELDELVTTYNHLGNNLPTFLDLFVKMKDEGIVTQVAIARFVQSAGKLARLEEESLKICDQIGGIKRQED